MVCNDYQLFVHMMCTLYYLMLIPMPSYHCHLQIYHTLMYHLMSSLLQFTAVSCRCICSTLLLTTRYFSLWYPMVSFTSFIRSSSLKETPTTISNTLAKRYGFLPPDPVRTHSPLTNPQFGLSNTTFQLVVWMTRHAFTASFFCFAKKDPSHISSLIRKPVCSKEQYFGPIISEDITYN